MGKTLRQDNVLRLPFTLTVEALSLFMISWVVTSKTIIWFTWDFTSGASDCKDLTQVGECVGVNLLH